jgi:hypothetical protein
MHDILVTQPLHRQKLMLAISHQNPPSVRTMSQHERNQILAMSNKSVDASLC